jgi:cation transport ATPase
MLSATSTMEQTPPLDPSGPSSPGTVSPAASAGFSTHEGFVLARSDLLRIIFVALAAITMRVGTWVAPEAREAVGLVAALIGGYPIFKEAIEALWARRMTMELSMTIGLLAALATAADATGGSGT